MSTRVQQIHALGQSIWCDAISRSLIESGALQRLFDQGIVGVTSNPTIFHQAIAQGSDYDSAIESLIAGGSDADAVYSHLTVTDVSDAADLLRPIYDRTDAIDGYISLEVNPHHAHDTDATVTEARRLFQQVDRPNLLIKVPATTEGIPAIETLIGDGISVNVTLVFSLAMYAKVTEAYIRGLERFAQSGGDLRKVASVASFFVSRVDTDVDRRLQDRIDAGHTALAPLLGKAAVANARLAYEQFRGVFHGRRFRAVRGKGARVQRPLWASTSTKNPAYPDTLYVDTLIGPETVNTVPLRTIDAVNDHGTPVVTIDQDLDAQRDLIADIESAGVAMDEVTDALLIAGVKAFADSFDRLMTDIKAKIAQLQTA